MGITYEFKVRLIIYHWNILVINSKPAISQKLYLMDEIKNINDEQNALEK